MKIKTSKLIGRPLDYAVAIIEGVEIDEYNNPIWFDSDGLNAERVEYHPSNDWSQGGPIIEREQILFAGQDGAYFAWLSNRTKLDTSYTSPTHLIAALRCRVASKLGDEVDVPEELT